MSEPGQTFRFSCCESGDRKEKSCCLLEKVSCFMADLGQPQLKEALCKL